MSTAEQVPGIARGTVLTGPAVPWPASTVPEQIRLRATERPDAVAIAHDDHDFTYAELVATADRVADALRRMGVAPGDRVLCLPDRTPRSIAALLGVMTAGAAYVPVEPGTPAGRLQQAVAACGARVVLAAEPTAADQISLDDLLAGTSDAEVTAAPPAAPDGPGDAAYVIFTSGSTGTPRAVMVEHGSVCALAAGTAHDLGLSAADVVLGFASFAFDVSVLDVWVPLMLGARVAVVDERDRRDADRMQSFLRRHAVTFGSLPRVLVALLDPDRLPAFTTVMTGDEAPDHEQVERWTAGSVRRRFLNCYGPTEATVQVLAFEAAGRWTTPLPIGRPLANHQVAVVDEQLLPVPDGAEGELLVLGPGLARGYLGDPEATAERWVAAPLGLEGRAYRTGDLVRLQPDGTLMFLGRLDRQQKIRGQRVDLDEVERVAAGVRGVDEAHAVVLDQGLVGLAVMPATAAIEAVLERCRDRLPTAAVPAVVSALDILARGPSGKVDTPALRRALAPARTSSEPPRGPDEEALAPLWAEALGTAAPGRDDDFFDCGGDSISAMHLVATIRTRLRRDVTFEDVLSQRTFAALAACVAGRGEPEAWDDVPTGSPREPSAAQRRLWFVDQLSDQPGAYNIAIVERIEGDLDPVALHAALLRVQRDHEVLRWRFPDAHGTPTVSVGAADALDWRQADAVPAEVDALVAAFCGEPFRLAAGPLWRALLLATGAGEWTLALSVHHAVFDGWSQDVLYTDLARHYADIVQGAGDRADAEAVEHTFADYVAWRSARDARRGAADQEWWDSHLEGAPSMVDLPRDRERGRVQSWTGQRASIALPAEVAQAVERDSRRLGVTEATVLLAGFAEAVFRLVGRTDVVIGTPVADRRNLAFEAMVGFFVEILPLRLRRTADTSVDALVLACRDALVSSAAHPSTTLDQVVARFRPTREIGTSPLVQVVFNVFNFRRPKLDLLGVRTTTVRPPVTGSLFDLTLYVVETDAGIELEATYNSDLYEADRVEVLLSAVTRLLADMLNQPDAPAAAAVMPGQAVLAAGLQVPDPAPLHLARPRRPSVGQAPGSRTEEVVARAWAAAIGSADFGIDDNFFDVGGSSLDLLRVRADLSGAFDRQIAVVDLFLHPTVRTLAAHLDGGQLEKRGSALDRAQRRRAAARQRSTRAPRPAAPTTGER
ncbi:non-ribosomal peptide synthetase [Nocardioides speluncae]|uniref:non-ribosomal peptide synthetase n=1 Tax=Nocardioides speluncae TaxID=2670337 RepID=UPI000D694300|nr:non-ribosomal peptide synthetase [Nocardioides speluncae]